jgi:hypothetical protein
MKGSWFEIYILGLMVEGGGFKVLRFRVYGF